MADFTRYELNLGKIDEKDAKLVLTIELAKYLNAHLEMHHSPHGSQYRNFSRFNDKGGIEKIVGEGALHFTGEFALSEPRIEINIKDNSISYRLSAEGVPSMPMPKEDIMHMIARQYELAGKFLDALRNSKLPPKHDIAKLESEAILEEIMKFDYAKYSGYSTENF